MGGAKVMDEYGFFHPSVGYWQTIGRPSEDILAAYPEGTAEVPLKSQANTEWKGSEWVESPPDLEQLASEARSKRNALLRASDWTQVFDVPVDQTAWAAYRKALRDITIQSGFPHSVTWPEQP